jgi:hypothetical protein
LKEEARLVRRLASLRAVIADYRSGDGEWAPVKQATQPLRRAKRAESQAATVLRVAEEFLSTARRRAPSAEIYREIAGRGIVIPGQKPESVISSYLSNSTKFDNVRGKGYGLTVWADGPETNGAPARAEAPKESAEVDALFR